MKPGFHVKQTPIDQRSSVTATQPEPPHAILGKGQNGQRARQLGGRFEQAVIQTDARAGRVTIHANVLLPTIRTLEPGADAQTTHAPTDDLRRIARAERPPNSRQMNRLEKRGFAAAVWAHEQIETSNGPPIDRLQIAHIASDKPRQSHLSI
jgi:hypothetical protein